jgi:hypothetical protein
MDALPCAQSLSQSQSLGFVAALQGCRAHRNGLGHKVIVEDAIKGSIQACMGSSDTRSCLVCLYRPTFCKGMMNSGGASKQGANCH